MKLEVKNGWFIEVLDSYYWENNWHIGVFETEEIAKQNLPIVGKQIEKHLDQLGIVFLPYVEYEGECVPFCWHTYSKKVE